MEETKVNLDNVLALLNLAENNPETLENVELEASQSSPPRTVELPQTNLLMDLLLLRDCLKVTKMKNNRFPE